jgi:hypothetical protein
MATNDPGSPSQPGQPGAPTPAQAAHVPGQGGPGVPGFDHRPISDGLENDLQNWLNRPVQDILNQFHMGQLPNVDAHDLFPSLGGAMGPNQLAGASGMGGGGNNLIGGLLKPATDLLGSVGNGVFQGMNPSQLFGPITSAFQQAASGLQQAISSMAGGGGGWAGQTAGQAATATGQTLAHGAATAAQGAGLGAHYTTAAADSSQGYARLLEAIQQGQDELSALAGGLPWTAANMVESASRTTARATAIVTELESTLTGEAAATNVTGAPVEAASQLPQLLGPMMSVGMSMISPAMQVGMLPATIGAQVAMQGMQAGLQAGTSLISSVGKGVGGPAAGAAAIPIGAGTHLAGAAMRTGGVGGAGGGLGAATTPARAVAASPMIQRETTTAALTSSSVARPAAVSGAGMGGGGMMGGAGMAGQGAAKAGAGNGSHTTASFLHTTDQGGEIVGDLGTASPPVIGEADPNADPDVKLRIT